MDKVDSKYVRELAEIMKANDVSVINIKSGNASIVMERNCTPATVAQVVAAPVATAEVTQEPKETFYEIKSPMVGVFYSAKAPGEKDFVKEGDTVNPGDTVCIIEAMKLMNDITAERAGTIKEICVKNGDIVEYGQVLFRLQ